MMMPISLASVSKILQLTTSVKFRELGDLFLPTKVFVTGNRGCRRSAIRKYETRGPALGMTIAIGRRLTGQRGVDMKEVRRQGAAASEDFPFKIEDNLGENIVTLERQYEGDTITVEVHMPNLVTGEDEGNDITTALAAAVIVQFILGLYQN